MMDKRAILNKVKEHLGITKNTELAKFLGLTSQAVSNWHARNKIDAELIHTKCPEISLAWLMSGEGSMLEFEDDMQPIDSSATNTLYRIKEYIDYQGISIRKFEESVGFSNGSFASQYKNNRTIGVDKVENILRVYNDINPTWLLIGEGSMLKKDVPIDEFMSKNSAINERIKELIDRECQGDIVAFAVKIGVPPSTVENIVGEKREKPGVEILERIVFVFDGISLDWLILGKGRKEYQVRDTGGYMVAEDPAPYGKAAEANVYYHLYREKEKEISELNKAIGRLEKENELLKRHQEPGDIYFPPGQTLKNKAGDGISGIADSK